jgi:hypothetical protein
MADDRLLLGCKGCREAVSFAKRHGFTVRMAEEFELLERWIGYHMANLCDAESSGDSRDDHPGFTAALALLDEHTLDDSWNWISLEKTEATKKEPS